MICYSDAGRCQRTPKCEHACDLRIQPVQRGHGSDASCWCLPVLDYTDPETGASVYVHQRPQ